MNMYKVAYKTRRGGYTVMSLTTLEEVGIKILALYKSRTAGKAWVDDKTQPGGRLIVGQVWRDDYNGWVWSVDTDEQVAQ